MAGQSEEQNTREPGQEGATNTNQEIAAHMYILHFVGDQEASGEEGWRSSSSAA